MEQVRSLIEVRMLRFVRNLLFIGVAVAAFVSYVRQHADSSTMSVGQAIVPVTGVSRVVRWAPIRGVDFAVDLGEYTLEPMGTERVGQFMREVLKDSPIATELMMVGDSRFPEPSWMRDFEEARPIRVGNRPLGDYEVQAGSMMFALLRPTYDAIRASRRVCSGQEELPPSCERALSLALFRQIALFAAMEVDESPTRMSQRNRLVAARWNPKVYLPGMRPERELEMHLDGFARYYFAEWWEGEYRRILAARALRLEVPALTRHSQTYVALSSAVEKLRANVEADATSLFTSEGRVTLSRIRAGRASDETEVTALIIMLRALEAAQGV